MKALVYHGPWDLSVEKFADPRPGQNEVLIDVVATGICGSDIHGFTGETGRRKPGQVMGHETTGVVRELGSNVGRGLRPGMPVTVNPLIPCRKCEACRGGREQNCLTRRVIGVDADIMSAFAELLLVPELNVVPLPERMPIEHGALVEPLSVGFHAASRGQCSDLDTVLVIGGGPIGQACILAANRLGAKRITVSEPNAARRSLAASLGASSVDPTEPGLASRVAASLGGAASLVLDAVGSTRSVQDAIACTGFDSRIVLVGMNAPHIDLQAYAISTEERTLIGSFCFSAKHFQDTAKWVATAPAVLASLVDSRVDLDGAVVAFNELARGESNASKVLVFPQGIT